MFPCHLVSKAGKVAVLILIFVALVQLYIFYPWDKLETPLNLPFENAAGFVFDESLDNNLSDSELQKRHFEAKERTRAKAMRLASKLNRLASFQMYIVPKVLCPTMVRVGTVGDGGKWVCNPWRVPKTDCVVYSLGINGEVSFEVDLHQATGRRCKFYCVDPGTQSPELFRSFNGVFIQSSIAGQTDPKKQQTSLLDLMRRFNHSRIDILKMDIESWEFDSLDGFFKGANTGPDWANVCQLLVEFHHTNEKLDTWLKTFEQLEEKGFLMFSKEANMYCPRCYEFSYIHVTCLEQYGLAKDAAFYTLFG